MKIRSLFILLFAVGITISSYAQELSGWGYNSNEQLNSNIGTYVLSPAKINNDSWRDVSCGYAYAEGIKQDGTLWGWGYNGDGKLGVGYSSITEPISSNIPIQVGTDKDWKTVSCGTTHTMAIKTNGTLWGWGSGNTYGQIGDGTTYIPRLSPVQIGTRNDYKQVITTMKATFALMNDGTIWSWGLGFYGELGNGSSSNIPLQIGTANNWAMIQASDYHTLAIKTDGTLWGWGDNEKGNLGDGTKTNKSEPIQIGTDNNWARVACVGLSSYGIKKDGTLWAWGDNQYGQLGNGSTTDITQPTQIGTETNWYKIFSGNYVVLALKKDGTLWAWGNNKYGMVGNGTKTDQNTPIQILSTNTYARIQASNTTCMILTGIDPESPTTVLSNMDEEKTEPVLSSNGFTVKNAIKNTLVRIFNIEGKLLFERKIENDEFINTDNLNSGIYIINIENSRGSISTKFWKK